MGEARAARAVVLLSGGASSRFGGFPKAAAQVDGEPAILRMARIAHEAGFPQAVAVLGAHATPLEGLLGPAGIRVEVNPDWAEGRTGSVQVGLRAVDPAAETLIWPVDHPFVAAATLRRLARAAEEDAMALWLIPSFGHRGGHPVLVRGPARAMVLDLPRSAPLRSVLPRLGPQASRIEVDDPGVVRDVATPEDFDRGLLELRARGATR